MEQTETKVTEEQRSGSGISNALFAMLDGKVSADKDIIKYAETHELKGSAPPAAPPIKKEKQERTIEALYRGTGKTIPVKVGDITSISRYIYVHNIFDPTPVIEHVQYKVIAPSTAYVVLEITEEIFNALVQSPDFKGKVHYNYIDDMAKNTPDKSGFYHRTFSVKYPEWIKPEDVQKQAQGIVSHYGIPNLSGIEKLLWPNFEGKVKKQSLSSDESVVPEDKDVTQKQPETPEE